MSGGKCYNSGFHFEVTPQKKCCLWPNSPQCQKFQGPNVPGGNICSYCCGKGFTGRKLPLVHNDGGLAFNYTPEESRWLTCNKFGNCSGRTTNAGPACGTPSGVR